MNKSLIFWIAFGFALSMFGDSIVIAKIKMPIQNLKDKEMNIDVWGLLRKEFKDGDKVVIIHDDTTDGAGSLCYGTLSMNTDRCLIGSKEFNWNSIIFMSHDGFPCRTLKLNMSNEQLDDIENAEIIYLMRKMLIQKPEKKIITKTFTPRNPVDDSYNSYSCGGCPFIFENINMKIINPFQTQHTNLWLDETLVMEAKDGAKGFMWDIENEIFDFGMVA